MDHPRERWSGYEGTLAISPTDGPDSPFKGYVINMYVAPLARRSGIGGALFDACLTWARTNGVRRVTLVADDGRSMSSAAASCRTRPSWRCRSPTEATAVPPDGTLWRHEGLGHRHRRHRHQGGRGRHQAGRAQVRPAAHPHPHPATPDAVADVVARIATHFEWDGPVGTAFPGVVRDGTVHTAANLDPAWVGQSATDAFAAATGVGRHLHQRRRRRRRGQGGLRGGQGGGRGRPRRDARDRHRLGAAGRRAPGAQHRARPPVAARRRRRALRRRVGARRRR
ncbi:MAG: GNAT family N-acetyltransferase [Acidimicrobiales bacterium]